MTIADLALLAGAGLLAGIVNAVAGGGTFFTFSALIATGIPPITANATSAVAVVPGSAASTLAYLREIRTHARRFALLCVVSAVGGAAGAVLLLRLENATFRPLVPYLLLAATILFALGPTVTRVAMRGRELGSEGARRAGTVIFQLLIAVYGGFFGAGMGIVMLAALAITEGDDFHLINAAKNLLATVLQTVAVGFFIAAGVIVWPAAAVITVASIIGGYLGVTVSRRIDPRYMRWFVIAVGALLTVYFFAT
jgi:uncharacterized membrane protein YfcA